MVLAEPIARKSDLDHMMKVLPMLIDDGALPRDNWAPHRAWAGVARKTRPLGIRAQVPLTRQGFDRCDRLVTLGIQDVSRLRNFDFSAQPNLSARRFS